MERDTLDFGKLLESVQRENVYILTQEHSAAVKALHMLPGNRAIKPKKVESLVEAYKNGDYIPPILVSLPFRFVTEGNHRVAAALECLKRNIPFTLRIYCYKDESSLETARLINNTQDRWKANDRLHSYVYERKAPYLTLKEFMDTYPTVFKKAPKYNIQAALCLLANGRQRQSMQIGFNSGNLVIRDAHVAHAHELMRELQLISEILNTPSVFVRDHTTAWDKARDRLGIPFTQYVVKLKKRATSWEEPKDSVEAWFNMYLKASIGL